MGPCMFAVTIGIELVVGGWGADGSLVMSRCPACARPPFAFEPNSRLGMALGVEARIQERRRWR